jgi:hypothetical protein
MKFRQLLLPTKENNYTPQLLQRAAMAMMLVMIMLSFAAVNLQALLWQSSHWLVGTVLPAVVVDLTNSERQELEQAPLRRSSVLDEAARLKAQHMAQNSYFAHYSPDGVSPWYWFDEVSYTYAHAGENLAIHFKDSGAVVNAWMDSPSHRANIVNSNYTEIGVGTAKGTYDGFDTVYVVQLFGTPALPAPVATNNNAPSVVARALAEVDTEVSEALAPQELVAGAEIDTEPALVAVDNEVITLDVNEGNNKPIAALTMEENKLEVAEVVSDSEQTSVFSTHFATSSGLTPVIGTVSGTTAEQISFVGSIATRPSALLQVLYLTLGLFVAFLLLSSIVIGIKYERPRQVVYGLALLLLMSGLFYVHASLTASVVVAAENETPILI